MTLKDRSQNFWQLACIGGTAHGLPSMVVGGALAGVYGPATAFLSILVGNVLLWIIGLGIISMAGERDHAIENVKGYLGKPISIFAALLWILAFVIWYIVQIKAAVESVALYTPNMDPWMVGLGLGTIVALLATGGIRMIKKLCVYSFPFMTLFLLSAMFLKPQTGLSGPFAISVPAVLMIVVIWLPGTVNLPTFFRHSKSRADSVLGLSLVTLFHFFFQISTIFIAVDDPGKYFLFSSDFGVFISFAFVVVSYVLSNLLNIYYASAGWETIAPLKRNALEYFFVGALGTIGFVLFQTFPSFTRHVRSMEFLELMLTNFIASLGTVLLIAFLIRLVVRHRPKPYEKLWSSISWVIGCTSALIAQVQVAQVHDSLSGALLVGVSASALSFLVIMFIEESIWSFRQLPKANQP